MIYFKFIVYFLFINIFEYVLVNRYIMMLHIDAASTEIIKKRRAILVLSLLGGTYGKHLSNYNHYKDGIKYDPLESLFDICLIIVQVYTAIFFLNIEDFSLKHTWPEFHTELLEIVIYVAIITVIAFLITLFMVNNDKLLRKNSKFVLILLAFLGASMGELLAIHFTKTKEQIEWLYEGLKIIMLSKIIVIVLVSLSYLYIVF